MQTSLSSYLTFVFSHHRKMPLAIMTNYENAVNRVQLGSIHATVVDFDGVMEFAREHLKSNAAVGLIVTPNLVQVAQGQSNPLLIAAYDQALLSPPDGWPVVAAVNLLRRDRRRSLGRVTGSDLLPALAAEATRIVLIGGKPDSGHRAAATLKKKTVGLSVLVEPVPPTELQDPLLYDELLTRVCRYAPDFVFVGLGVPKQERVALELCTMLDRGLVLCVGAAIDFAAGSIPRAPQWVQRLGFEWAHRIVHEPRRLFGRYLTSVGPFIRVLVLEGWSQSRASRLRRGSKESE